ncbi:Mu transposase C-terminal domain-containing protein [Streptomyces sp. NPDC057575]|uniref:Mu transposase C-terminal domain-containing protein n=1 Tax=unclassified Streptomyces TaxID=2593676 RepID=UPI0036C585ED
MREIPAADLWPFTLEDDARTRTLTSHGPRFRNRSYLADWMTGQAGRKVTVRFMMCLHGGTGVGKTMPSPAA